MKKYNIILLPILFALLLCGCSQITAADADSRIDTTAEIETVSNAVQQSESEDDSALNSADGEVQASDEYMSEQLKPYIEELEKINEEFGFELVMCLSDSEEIAGAYDEFCSMSAEEFRDEIIGRINGNTAFVNDGDGNLIPKPHFIDVEHKEEKLAELQPYIEELEKINEELGINLAISLSSPEEIARAYKEYCSMSIEEYRYYVTNLYGMTVVSHDEDGDKITEYSDN